MRVGSAAVTFSCVLSLVALVSSRSVEAQSAAASPSALVKFEIVNDAIPASLTGKAGDPRAGEKVVIGRTLGNCLACHAVTALKKEEFHGNTGPSLDGVGGRLNEGELRLRLVDSTKVNSESMMPSFYRVDGLNRVRKEFQGKPVLTAEQIEDVVAFLKTLQ